MPTHQELASAYRARVLGTRELVKSTIAARLIAIDLDLSRNQLLAALAHWVNQSTLRVAAAQHVAVHTSELYLLGALATGGGQRMTFPDLGVTPADFVGVSYGRPVPDQLFKAANGIFWRLDAGYNRQVAMTTGVGVAARTARVAVMSAARESLTAGMDKHPEVSGWTRVAGSTACEACSSDVGTFHSASESLDSHPSCGCTQAPEVQTADSPSAEGGDE